jgi:hypothetical protein
VECLICKMQDRPNHIGKQSIMIRLFSGAIILVSIIMKNKDLEQFTERIERVSRRLKCKANGNMQATMMTNNLAVGATS